MCGDHLQAAGRGIHRPGGRVHQLKRRARVLAGALRPCPRRRRIVRRRRRQRHAQHDDGELREDGDDDRDLGGRPPAARRRRRAAARHRRARRRLAPRPTTQDDVARRAARRQGRGRAGEGRHARLRHRGRHAPTRGRRTGRAARPACYVLLAIGVRPAVRGHRQTARSCRCSSKSVEHNADYTEWTMHIRDGIKFQDGTPLDGAAVKFNIDSCQYCAADRRRVTRRSTTSTASGQDVTITTRAARGSPCPRTSPTRQCALHVLAEVAGQPARRPAAQRQVAGLRRRAGRDAGRRRPGQAGRARCVQVRVVHAGQRQRLQGRRATTTTGVARTASPVRTCRTSTRIEAVVAVDDRQPLERAALRPVRRHPHRQRATRSASSSTTTASRSTRRRSLRRHRLHHAERRRGRRADPEGKNADSPLLNVDCRRALARRSTTSAQRGARRRPRAGRPTVRSRPARSATSRTPATRSSTRTRPAPRWTSAWRRSGTDHIEFTFNTTNDPFNVESNTLIVSMWSDAFGDKVKATITPIEQGQYIGLALTGAFQALGWRSHGGIDPDQQRLLVAEHRRRRRSARWRSTSAASRTRTSTTRSTSSRPTPTRPPARRPPRTINRIFGEQVYNLWLTWALWGDHHAAVRQRRRGQRPARRQKGIGLAFAGRHQINQIWCDDGNCGRR